MAEQKQRKKIILIKREYYRGRWEQILIYLGKLFRMFIYQNDWKVLPMSALIAGLVTFVVGSNIYVTQEGTLTGCFAIVCVCIWNGFFNSIQVVCRERNILKREHRSGLHITSYVIAHMIYQFFLCACQTVITTVVCYFAKIHFPKESLVTPWFVVDFAITLFLITYSSDMISLAISSFVKTTTTAMTVMPFMLIFQLVFSGGFFQLSGYAEKATVFTVSKWGLEGLCTIGNYNKLSMVTLWNTIFKFREFELEGQKPLLMVIKEIERRNMVNEIIQKSGEYNQNAAFVFTEDNILRCWGILLLFAVIFAVVSVILLEFVDRDKR